MIRRQDIVLALCIAATLNPSAKALTLTASLLSPLPVAITNNAVASVDHGDGTYTLYSIMGTTNPAGGSASAATYKLDWPGGAWTQVADAPRLNGRAKVGASAISIGEHVYLIGGYTRGSPEITEKRLFRYDAANNQYVQLANVPVEVDDTVVGVFQDRYIILTSGWHGPIGNNVLNVQVYDTITDQWQQATPVPGPATGVFGHAGTVIGNRIISIDGTTATGSFSIADNVFVGEIQPIAGADSVSVSWTELPAHPGLPTYRAAASQGGVDGRMLVLGGSNNPYNVSGTGYNGQPALPLDQALLFDPLSGGWQTANFAGDYLPSMDHRGLVRLAGGWVTLGGMLGPALPTNRVVLYSIPEPASAGIFWSIFALAGAASVRSGPTPNRRHG